jgi:HEAT repeat protein
MSSRKTSNQCHEQVLPARRCGRMLCLILATALVAFIAGCRQRPSSTSALASATVSAKQEAPVLRPDPRHLLAYDLHYVSESSSDLRVLFADKSGASKDSQQSGLVQSFKTDVRGEFVVTVLDRDDLRSVVSYQLRNSVVRLIANGQEAHSEAEIISADLNHNIFAEVNPQGRVLSVRFDPSVGNLSQSFARSIIALTQFCSPASQTSELEKWEVQEDDPAGQYIARYQTATETKKGAPDDGGADIKSFRKTKLRYLKTSSSDIEAPKTVTPKGSLSATFDLKAGRLLSVIGAESQVIAISGKNVAKVETELQMDYSRQEMLSDAEFSVMRSDYATRERVATPIPLSMARSREETEALIHRNELGTASVDDLLAQLAQIEVSNDGANETSLYLKFKALVYLHPETAASLGAVLAKADATSVTMRILTGALAAIGSERAQAALVTAILAHAHDWPALAGLIPALSQAVEPAQGSEDILRDLAFNSSDPEIASTSQLALGTMARQLAVRSPDRAAAIVHVFLKRIEASDSSDATRQTLLVLGNAGSAIAFPTIAGFTTDQSTSLRAAAVTALRWIESDQADALLLKALKSDPQPIVRLDSAVALGVRKMNQIGFNIQKQAFLTDKDDKVRLAVLNNLWKAHATFPEVRGLVKRAAAKDRSKDVRKAASVIISGYPKNYFIK